MKNRQIIWKKNHEKIDDFHRKIVSANSLDQSKGSLTKLQVGRRTQCQKYVPRWKSGEL